MRRRCEPFLPRIHSTPLGYSRYSANSCWGVSRPAHCTFNPHVPTIVVDMHPKVFTEVALPLKSLAARRLIVPSDFKSHDQSLCYSENRLMGMNMKQTCHASRISTLHCKYGRNTNRAAASGASQSALEQIRSDQLTTRQGAR